MAMDLQSKQRLEYEQQAFGITSDLILSTYKDFLNDQALLIIGKMEDLLRKRLVPSASDGIHFEEHIKKVMEDLVEKFKRGINKAVRIGESKVRDCFALPDNFHLEEDRIILSVQDLDSVEQKTEVEDLRQKLLGVKYMREMIEREIKVANCTINVLRKVLEKGHRDTTAIDDILNSLEEGENQLLLNMQQEDNLDHHIAHLTINE